MAMHRKRAAAASADAQPKLLALLDSVEMRAVLRRCCPHLAEWKASALLEELHSNVESAEIVHTFDGSFDAANTVDLDLHNATNFFPLQWQLRYLGWTRTDPIDAMMENTNEMSIFSLAGFTGVSPKTMPGTFAEASSRVLYGSLNLLRIDEGNRAFGYGNVTAVVSPSFWADAVAAAPFDTGSFSYCCNASLEHSLLKMNGSELQAFCAGLFGVAPAKFDRAGYCNASAYCNSSVCIPGVHRAMDHALLANDRAHLRGLGRSTIARLFERWHGTDEVFTNVTGKETFDYIESNVLANLLYGQCPIKLLVGSFPALFGTAHGKVLQEMALNRSIALTWAYGTGVVDATMMPQERAAFNANFSGRVRLLDPVVARALPGPTINASVSELTASAFTSAWAAVEAARDPHGGLAPERVASFWHKLTAGQPAASMLHMPAPLVCADWGLCIGSTSDDRTCVCYSS